MPNVENNALANSIDLVKNYVSDPDNLYGVLRAGLLTADLDTPFVEFIGARTASFPSFPLNSADLPDYSSSNGYSRVDVNYKRVEKTVSQDKGYQIAVDQLDLEDGHLTAIAIVNNQVRQMEVPTIDKYRLKALADNAGTTATINLSSSDPFTLYDTAVETLIENEIPKEGTILYCTPDFYSALKQSDSVRRTVNVNTNSGDVNREIITLDGVTKVVEVPSTRMPSNVKFILVQPKAVVAGIKRSYSNVIEHPEDFDGILINRRLVHDLFVLDTRTYGVYVGSIATSE